MDRCPAPFAVTGAAVIDGTGGPVLPDRDVLVRDGRIERVEPAGAVAPPPGIRRIEGAGRTLLPGFVDAHVHLDFYPPATVLRGGVTTVRDLGWPPARLKALRRDAERSPTASPRLLAAGPIITSPGGYPSPAAWAPPGTAREVDGTEQAVAAVAELADGGASVIKVALDPTRGAPALPAPTLAAVVGAARERGLGVTAHVNGAAEVLKALDAGVTELAHWPFGEELPGELVRRVAAAMAVVPTLHIDPSPARRRGIRRFVAAGGRVLYGTDLGNQGPPPAVDVTELELLVEAGLSPVGAVAAATSLAAEHLGLRGIGKVAPGWVADLLLVDGDPLEDPRALTRVRLVSRAGWIAG
jgi:imidazolonepropionase-like amidohydrolase